jgi:hypothetical protein
MPRWTFRRVLTELWSRVHSVEPPIDSIVAFVQSTDADGNALGDIRRPMVDAFPLDRPK